MGVEVRPLGVKCNIKCTCHKSDNGSDNIPFSFRKSLIIPRLANPLVGPFPEVSR